MVKMPCHARNMQFVETIMAQGEYRLVVDARERELMSLFAGAVQIRTLDVGDVLCEYGDGTSWVVERKTAADC